MGNSEIVSTLKKLGQLYGSENMPLKEIGVYKDLLELEPHNWQWHYLLGKALEKIDCADSAIESYKKAIKINSSNAELYYLLGKALVGQRDYKRAVEACYQAINLSPKSAYSYCILGDSLLGLSQFQEAILAYDKAIELKSSLYFRVFLYLKAGIQGAVGNFEDKIQALISCCEEHIHTNPSSFSAHAALTISLCEGSNFEEAINALVNLIELSRYSSNLLHQLALNIESTLRQAYEQSMPLGIERSPAKIIYFSQQGGLCNRLRTLCSCLCLSQFWSVPLLICWEPSKTCNINITDLFQSVFNIISLKEMVSIIKEQHTDLLFIADTAMGHESHYREFLSKDENISYSYWQEKYLKIARNLPIRSEIEQLVSNFIEKNWTENIVGVHVRRTDHVKHFSRDSEVAKALSTDEGFYRKISEEIAAGTTRFFLATDDIKVRDSFEKKFPGKFITYCDRFDFDASSLRQTSIQDALIELYLLSRTRKLIGSNHSTFSTYASDLGNIPIEFA